MAAPYARMHAVLLLSRIREQTIHCACPRTDGVHNGLINAFYLYSYLCLFSRFVR